MNRIKQITNINNWMVLVVLFTIHYLLFTSTARAQIGSWQAYMAYHEIQQIQSAGDDLFVLASNDLYQYHLTDQSIITYDKVSGLSDTDIKHIAWNKQAKRLIAVYQNSNIDLVDCSGNVTNISALYAKATTADKTVDSVTVDGIYAYLYARLGIVKVNMERAEITNTYTENNPDYPTSLPASNKADYQKYYSLVATLSPGGPKYNFFHDGLFANGKLYTVGGYFLSGVADLNRPGTVQVWDGNDWNIYQDQLRSITGYQYVDNNCIDIDPVDSGHVAVGGRCGLYEFQNGRLLKNHHQQNSLIRGAMDRGKALGNDYNLINGLKYDSKGNLWVLNSQAKGVNLLKLTHDGQWVNHYQKELADRDSVGLMGLCQMMIDSRGWLWFVNSNWNMPAVFCYDTDNNILLKYADFTNQDGTKYNISYVNDVSEDLEHNIWVATNLGPFVIMSNEVGQQTVTFEQIKVPRNDGSNYADYLLNGVNINSISIDGAGRKWFCTNGAGVFLISADNLTQLQNFTIDNSELLSDNVSSAIIDNKTGQVYFLTESGLCSYHSDATEAATEMSKDNVYAYPNPVTPDYTGVITVVGLSLNADVKILSTSGKMIAEGRSNGGSFVWDRCDRHGKRVASGVYMVVTATNDGKKGTVCKIAIIN